MKNVWTLVSMYEMNKKHNFFLVAIKLLLLISFLYFTNPTFIRRIQEIGFQLPLVFFVFIWLLGASIFIAIAFLKLRILRFFWTGVWLIISVFSSIYWSVTNKDLGISDIETLLGLTAFIDNIWLTYQSEVIRGCMLGSLGVLALSMPPFLWSPAQSIDRSYGRKILWFAIIPSLPMILIVGTLYLRNGEGTSGMPNQFKIPGFLMTLAVEVALKGSPPLRQIVSVTPQQAERPKHVVIVMDESIRGDLLDINNPGSAHSGLLEYKDRITNFGVASSLANCSASSNVSFRYAVTRENYLNDIKRHPSIWAYAKKAGYRTYYLDGQRESGGLQNFMDEAELREIDEFFQLPKGTKPADRDINLARKIRGILLETKQAAFIYVNKMGAHFPYEGKYPETARSFHPTLVQSYLGNTPDIPAAKSTGQETEVEHLQFKNSYLNAVSWNVGGFFKELLPQLDLREIILLYTSDHGQDLHENGKKGLNTHCNSGAASPEEGRVPLFVMSGDPVFLSSMQAAAKNNFNKASQFNVVPSVLSWLGYDITSAPLKNNVEKDLTQDLRIEDQKFLSTYFVRFGSRPYWNTIR